MRCIIFFLFAEDVDESSPDQDAVRSLLQELAFLRRIRHPGFLEVMAACHVTHPSPDHVTLIYQHVPHGSLYHHLHVQVCFIAFVAFSFTFVFAKKFLISLFQYSYFQS